MATLLDVSLLKFFLPAFTFLFIVILSYAMFRVILKDLDDRAKWIASVSLGLIALFSGSAIDLINFITPWFVVIMVFLVLVFMSLMFWTTKPEEMQKDILSALGGINTIVIIGILIVVLGISQVFGPVFDPYAPGGPAERTIGGETIRTLFHPRILGAIFILIVAAFAIQRITDVTAK
ncbi:hypothetical protein HYX18_03285 [Candidatus Woesearchaeota archaeon]|nr:hypothetical protein [Candidatus Woesearchaeota archaeon]